MGVGEKGVFFGWEKRRGLSRVRALGRARVRQVIALLVLLVLAIVVWRREERAAGVRATRAAIGSAERAVYAWRADHAGSCPAALSDLHAQGYVRDPLVDAWGRPLHLVCPGRKDPKGFDVFSDGPDGVYGGLDRVE
jgi:general secretion pathway protein G